MSDKECFIIMPITTPADFIPVYGNDPEHFLHVMECLFNPAIEKAGFKPILPLTQGSEIIHGEIISNIETCDLVLCDMSILNPNVFFELGIRTALNKPVCLVKDMIIEKVPFDTNIINYYTYCPDLSSWIVKYEIEKLANHIKESFKKSNNCNSLWKFFSLRSIATPPEKLNGEAGKIEYLTMQVEAIRKQLNDSKEITIYEPSVGESYKSLGEGLTLKEKVDFALKDIYNLIKLYDLDENGLTYKLVKDKKGPKIILSMENKQFKDMPSQVFDQFINVSKRYGINIELVK